MNPAFPVAPRPGLRLLVLAALLWFPACAGTLTPPSVTPNPHRDALLLLPGFGYGQAGERTFRSLAPAMASDGIDLYVPAYLTRSGLASSRSKLERYIHDQHLDRYERLHVFAFIAGAWTINPLVDAGVLPNLASVVYDRSPFQERAPAVAVDRLRTLAWLRYGSTIFDVARTPYAPVTAPGVQVALLVESTPTKFIKHHEQAARAFGPFAFDCGAFRQRYDDCAYTPLNHDELYVGFADLWPELRAFIRTGRFSSAMTRTAPAGDPLADRQPR
jgi:hypothetical protein